MDEMSVWLDDGTDLGEDQKKNLSLGQPRINFIFIFFVLTKTTFFFF
jgi:hypothetical protein